MLDTAGNRRTPSNSVRSVKMFWKVKYSLRAGRQTLQETCGCSRMALTSEANKKTLLPQYQYRGLMPWRARAKNRRRRGRAQMGKAEMPLKRVAAFSPHSP